MNPRDEESVTKIIKDFLSTLSGVLTKENPPDARSAIRLAGISLFSYGIGILVGSGDSKELLIERLNVAYDSVKEVERESA